MQETGIILYSSVTLLSAILCAMAIFILLKTDHEKRDTRDITRGIVFTFSGLFLGSMWRTIQKSLYASRDASAWMNDHIFVAIYMLILLTGIYFFLRFFSNQVAAGLMVTGGILISIFARLI